MILILAVFAAALASAEAPEKALCVVCAHGGETELEKVVASREYRGATYHFCSKQCAASFDANPAAYVFEIAAAPVADWTTTAGDSISLSSMRGKVVLLDFWATWCKPCVKTMPELDAMYRDLGTRGLVVVGVSVDQGDDRAQKVAKFLEKRPVGYPIVIDDAENASWEAFNVAVLPTMYLIDREGRVVQRWAGVVDVAAVRGAVEHALGARPRGD